MNKRLLCLALGLIALSLASCGSVLPPTPYSSLSGSSASSESPVQDERYQIYLLAQNAGFIGTYEEWLASIRGADGSSLLNGNGAPGANIGKDGDTYIDTVSWDVYVKTGGKWAKVGNVMGAQGPKGDNGKDGKDGQDGRSAYEIYCESHPEYTGTEEEWLDDLVNGRLGTEEATYYTVTFDLGYEKKTFTQRVKEGKKASRPPDPTRDGYDFLDWVDAYGDHWVFNGFCITEDITLYARWSDPIIYTITFVNDDGSLLGTQTGHYGDPIVYDGETPVAANQNPHYVYEFEGWDKDLIITGDMTLTAQYASYFINSTAYYYDYDGTLLATVPLKEGEAPSYPGETPEREDDKDAQLQFQFESWEKTEETSDSVSYKANYVSCTRGLDIEGPVATYYHGTAVQVTVPSKWNGAPLTSIGDKAFYNCSSLTSVEIPTSVTSIGSYAFRGCAALVSAAIPSSVVFIGQDAFYGCSSLTSVEIPASVSSIRNGVFNECSSLTSVEIPASVTSIGSWAFRLCTSLTSVEIPSLLVSIDYDAFWGCSSLQSIEIPASVTSIGSGAFTGCSSLKSVEIPASVISVGGTAFDNCKNLVILCEAAYKPQNWATNWNGDTPVVWGSSNAKWLGSIKYSISETDDAKFASVVEISEGTKELDIPVEIEGALVKNVFPSALRSIQRTLEKLSIPNISMLNNVEMRDFFQLSEVKLGDATASIPETVFSDCSSLTSVTIPSSVTSIGRGAFYHCSSLQSIEIPSSVTSIGVGAFQGCSSLASIEIPSSVTSIDVGTFYGCSSLESVVIHSSVTSIGDSAFWDCSSLTSVTIPPSVTSIGIAAFCECSSLASITIPSSVTSIGRGAFNYCESLKTVTFLSMTPPQIGEGLFHPNLLYSGFKIYVPKEAVENYKTTTNQNWDYYTYYICAIPE